MSKIKGSDRRHLRGLANPLKTLVQVGDGGVTSGVVAAVDAALSDHELVKVRIAADRPERAAVASQIAAATRAELAGTWGGSRFSTARRRTPRTERSDFPRHEPDAALPVSPPPEGG